MKYRIAKGNNYYKIAPHYYDPFRAGEKSLYGEYDSIESAREEAKKIDNVRYENEMFYSVICGPGDYFFITNKENMKSLSMQDGSKYFMYKSFGDLDKAKEYCEKNKYSYHLDIENGKKFVQYEIIEQKN